jgi:hypothetical protein
VLLMRPEEHARAVGLPTIRLAARPSILSRPRGSVEEASHPHPRELRDAAGSSRA